MFKTPQRMAQKGNPAYALVVHLRTGEKLQHPDGFSWMKYLYLIFIVVLLSFLITTKVLSDTETFIPPPLIASTTPVYTDEFIRIGGCESTGKPYGAWEYHAKNKYSSASGVFEFINSSWYQYGRQLWGQDFYEKNIWTEDNVELAWYVYQKYGTKDWDSSKSCWQIKTPRG